MTEVSSIMAKICNINFWIENDPPPPLQNFFRKLIRFGGARLPLWIKLGRTGFEISFFMRQEFNIFKAV